MTVTDTGISPGVTLSRTAFAVIEEATQGESYTVKLDTQPSQDVTITPQRPSGSDLVFDPVSVTFTMTDWSNPKPITVTAGTDTDTDNDIDTVTHDATSTDSNYSGIDVDDVIVTVTEPPVFNAWYRPFDDRAHRPPKAARGIIR